MTDQLDRIRSILADRYTIVREIGRGGMATVYLAQDLKHERQVAIKVLRPELAASLGSQRFLREVRIAAQLNHPNVLAVHDSGEFGDLLYYVMPYVAGESLRQRLERERHLSIDEALRIAARVAEGLHHAHERGVVHRDVKPENILLSHGQPLLADFGVARAVSLVTGESRTTEGIVVGTPAYMSPEQAGGERDLDGRSDIYSLGCVLFEMLAGEPPFSGPTDRTIIARQVSQPPPSLRVIRPTVPDRLEQIVNRALAKVPADRQGTAAELASALDAEREQRPAARVRRSTVPAVVAVLLVVIGFPIVRWLSSRPQPVGERTWVLVADFDGPTNDPELGVAVRELVWAELNQSKYFSAVPRSQLRAAMQGAGLPDSARVDVDLATNLATRSAVRTILYGSVRPIGGDIYSIVLHAISAEDGSNLLSRSTTAALGENLIRSVERLVREARAGLGERRRDIEANRPLVNVATPSLPAYRRMIEAVVLEGRGQTSESRKLLLEAVRIDSAFASAWAMLVGNYLTDRQLDSARWASQQALRYPDRLTEVQQASLRANVAYNVEYDLPEAVRWYERVVTDDPNLISGWNNLGVYLSSMGRHEEAVEKIARAAAVDPFFKGPRQLELLNLGAELVMVGRLDSARAAFGRLEEPYAGFPGVMLPASTNDWPVLEVQSRALRERPDALGYVRFFATTALPGAVAAQGGVLEAERLLDEAMTAAAGATARWYGRARVLMALASDRVLSDVPEQLARDTTAGGAVLAALWRTALGDTTAAAWLDGRMERWDDVTTRRMGHGPAAVNAWVALRSGDARRTVDLLAPAALEGEHDAFSLDRVDSFMMRRLVAEAYARLGLTDSAAAYMELVLDPTRLPAMHYALRGIPYVFAHRRLAEWYERLEMPERGLEHWRALVGTLSKPDAETRPLYDTAVAAVRRLEVNR